MATWIEVADTAVKIGLSAMVGGIGAYALARRNERHDFAKEFFRRRQDVIERVAKRFDRIHIAFLDVCVDYCDALDIIPSLPLGREMQDRLDKHLHDIGENLREMHVLEGQLIVAGAEEATAALRQYRSHAADVNGMIQLNRPTHTKDQIDAAIKRFAQLRDDFYRAMAKPYKHG